MTNKKRARILHCKLCGKASPSYCKTFKRQMAWLRRHRKKKHPTAHKKSVKKSVKTKKQKKKNPCTRKRKNNPSKRKSKRKSKNAVKEYRKYTTLTPEGRAEFLKTVGKMR